MKKFFKIFIFLIFLAYLIYYINEKNRNFFSSIKNFIPLETKQFILKYLYYIPKLNKSNQKLLNDNLSYSKYIVQLENKIIDISNTKFITNEEIFPQTQFTKLEYHEINLNLPQIDRNESYLKDGNKTTSFYVEISNNKYYYITKNGNIYYSSPNNISDYKQLKSNLPSEINITDSEISENFLYIIYSIHNLPCGNFFIIRSKLEKSELIFEEIYSNIPKNKNKCEPLGGRIEIDASSNVLYFTSKNNDFKNYLIPDQYFKDNEYKFAMIGQLDLSNFNVDILSTGHRNPQGLLYTSNNKLISTEHGPRGGDEINLITKGKNYGWPISSYGENYRFGYSETEDYLFKKNHESLNFEEPIFSFIPSIGISQVIELDNNFSKKWQDNLIVSSLRAGSLFRIKTNNQSNKILFYEKIRIGKRIRDLNFDFKNNSIILALENDSGYLGVIKVAD